MRFGSLFARSHRRSASRRPSKGRNHRRLFFEPLEGRRLLIATVTGVDSTASAGAAFNAGDAIEIAVTFSENVVVTGVPELALNAGAGTATYTGGTGSATLTFTYTVAAGQNASPLDYDATDSLTGGTIQDTAMVDANRTLPTVGTSALADDGLTVDTTAPTVTAVDTSAAQNASHNAGDVITITVTFSESVVVTDVPALALNAGAGASASYVSGTGTDTLTFTYTVAAGHNAATLDYSSTAALTGGAIKDNAGNDADRTLPALDSSALATKDIAIDTVAPVVTVTTPVVTNDTTPTLTGTVTDALPTSDIANVTITVGGQILVADINGTSWSVTVPVALAAGIYTVDVTAADEAGNASANVTGTLTVDTTAPTVTVNALTTGDNTPTLTGTVTDPPTSGGLPTTISIHIQGVTDAGFTLNVQGTISGTNWTANVNTTLPVGTYTVTATVTDTAGNVGTGSTVAGGLSIVAANSSLSGFVVLNAANDGVRGTHVGIGDVAVTLFQQQNGTFVQVQTVLTAANGSYTFSNLIEGTYRIVETQPQRYRDGVDKAGTINGTASGTLTQPDTITNIVLGNNQQGIEYNFGERGFTRQFISNSLKLASTPSTSQLVQNLYTPPSIQLSGATSTNFTANFITNGAAVPIAGAATATVTQADGGWIGSMTVTITNLQDGADEVLAANTAVLGANPRITANYSNGVLVLTGPAPAADYQAVLRTITYDNNDATPTTVARSITFLAVNPVNSSNIATATVNIQPAA